MKGIRKVLVANRGEIAVRIMRTLREMGIKSVAVYSEADKKALHVRFADEAYLIGPPPSAESYLRGDKIIDVAKKSGCDAIHPGYGFLSENTEFAKAVRVSGLIFIGPDHKSIELMGSKTESRRAMESAGLPVVPGLKKPVKDEDELSNFAREIGFPLLLKADLGGGGKGMRLIKEEKELITSFRMACSEALSAFGDSSIYIEKYIEEPHHIEIQILVDEAGNAVYLGERECSIQRRYQKVVEETPSPFLDEDKRREIGEMAVSAIKKIGYLNAGTIEFIVDKNKNFYFLEMNTRLQVEHPITEMVTGIDLVKCQIEIAEGKKLPFYQDDIKRRGWAIECRIYAEDPDNDFAPSPGRILRLQNPEGGLGVRIDSGVYEGFEVPIYYDPLIAKLISWGRDRDEAMQRMRRALLEYHIVGIKTTIPFFLRVLQHPDFVKGNYNTHFVERLESEEKKIDGTIEDISAVVACLKLEGKAKSNLSVDRRITNRWKKIGLWYNFQNRL
ncbi:MAG: acetyl-CoA carboxylase biotin carboxylase subunit [Candidatus Aminicenantia bacterium]